MSISRPDERLASWVVTARWSADLAVVALAATAAAADWALWVVAGKVDLAVVGIGGEQRVSLATVLVATVVTGLAGVVLLRWWTRRSPSGLDTWTVLAIALGMVSLASTVSTRSVAAALALASVHVVVGAILVVGLRRVHSG